MSFHALQLPSSSAFNDLYIRGLLGKWDLQKSACLHAFSYTKYYHKMQPQEFLLDLFNDPAVRATFQVRPTHDGLYHDNSCCLHLA